MVSGIIPSPRAERAGKLPVHRVEHRTDGRTSVVARTTDVYARQQELSLHAARLIADSATGELVLVEEASGQDVARRSLRPETPSLAPFTDGAGGQHDTRGWLGSESRPAPRWSPAPLPNQHRFADVETRSRAFGNGDRRDDPA